MTGGTIIFVDRDMFMRYLGYGIGHKDQTKCIAPSDEAGDQDDLENDDLDLQNIARIARNQVVQPILDVANGGAINSTEDSEDDLDADSDTELDDEYDLDGHF
ncbi:hypothetical protein HYPSUDRAFT_199589 [Hypholoma sublateritium FD-334 SS-4]|uniref:Uncharacterized protein n=1 Tax=Hypholoma sublateritium (strain FD-334 SS-4) TaxID=945553 RepID=A0A0D2MPN1_HYPSF|nr:hypothetical protein HYPSUDRAFT_199589 [Hypholoma sublateritium FD-334 SS-4]